MRQEKEESRMQDVDVDIVLIYPKTGMDIGSTVAPPHSLLAVAAGVRKNGFRVKIIDQRVDANWKKTLTDAIATRPICVGISSMTGTQVYFAIEVAKIVRNLTNGKIPIIWGGTHASILPEQTLKSEYVDIVCIGEGEITLLELARAIQSHAPLKDIQGIAFKDGPEIVITRERPLLDVEALLPTPWELINVNSYIHPDFYLKKSNRTLDIGQTSRGCPFLCGFCSSASIRKRQWRPMSVERSLERIIEPVKNFNLNGIWIRDDEFYIDKKRAEMICEGIIRAGLKICWYTSGTRVDVFNKSSDEQIALLKRSGAYVLKFGAESGSNRILKLMNKGIRREDTIEANLRAKKHGIIPAFAFMIGFPTETFEEINQTIDLAMRLLKDNPKAQLETMAPYTALPGTPLFQTALEMGLRTPQVLSEWANWTYDEYDFEGKKIPWFDYKGRIKIGNIAYISMLSNALLNAVGSIKNSYLRSILKVAFRPIIEYYRFKLKRKWYTFAPELNVIRYLRKKLFYKSYIVIK